jgi:hypothetical protein
MPVRCSALATIEIALRWSPIICASSCRISGKLRSSQWSRAPNRQRDRRASTDVACGGLFCVREQGLFVPYKQASQRRAPIGCRPEIANAENRNCARQKNHRVGQRDPAAERGRDAENAVAPDRRHFDCLSLGEDGPASRSRRCEADRHASAGRRLNQDSFSDQLDDLEMRTQRLELGCRQRAPEMIG